MTYTEIETFLYNWISAQTSLEVIFANENGVKPKTDFIIINIMQFSKIGQRDLTSPDNITEIRKIIYQEDFNVELNAYGLSSLTELQKIKDSLQKNEIEEYFCSNGVAVRSDSDISNISTLVDTKIEKRYLYEITCGFARDIEENMYIIEDFDFSGTYSPPS